MKQIANIIHVEFLSSGEHEYYGGIAAIYENYKVEDIGCNAHSLYQYNIEPGKPFRNRKVIIRKGILTRCNTRSKNKNKG